VFEDTCSPDLSTPLYLYFIVILYGIGCCIFINRSVDIPSVTAVCSDVLEDVNTFLHIVTVQRKQLRMSWL
jgi:hypothetical protein